MRTSTVCWGLQASPRTIDDDLQTTSVAAYRQRNLCSNRSLQHLRRPSLDQRREGIFPHDIDLLQATQSSPPIRHALRSTSTTRGMTSHSMLSARLSSHRQLHGLCTRGAGVPVRWLQRSCQQPRRRSTVRSGKFRRRTKLARFKSDWLDSRLRRTFTVFYNDYRRLPGARFGIVTTDPGTILPSIELSVFNAGQLEIERRRTRTHLSTRLMPFDSMRRSVIWMRSTATSLKTSVRRLSGSGHPRFQRQPRVPNTGVRAGMDLALRWFRTPSNSQMTLRSCWPVQRAIAQRWRLLSTAR